MLIYAFMAFAMFFLLQGTGLPGVVPIIEGTAAATLTGYLVGFFKKARPTGGDGAIVAIAIAAGLLSSVVISMVNGGIALSQFGIGTIILQGIGAAALAAGVQGANKPSVDKPAGP